MHNIWIRFYFFFFFQTIAFHWTCVKNYFISVYRIGIRTKCFELRVFVYIHALNFDHMKYAHKTKRTTKWRLLKIYIYRFIDRERIRIFKWTYWTLFEINDLYKREIDKHFVREFAGKISYEGIIDGDS